MKKSLLIALLMGLIAMPVQAEVMYENCVPAITAGKVTKEDLNKILNVADATYMVASPFIYSKRPDLLKHYVFTNGLTKLDLKTKYGKKYPKITATTVFVVVTVGKELVWDLALKKGHFDVTDIVFGNLPGALVNLKFKDKAGN